MEHIKFETKSSYQVWELAWQSALIEFIICFTWTHTRAKLGSNLSIAGPWGIRPTIVLSFGFSKRYWNLCIEWDTVWTEKLTPSESRQNWQAAQRLRQFLSFRMDTHTQAGIQISKSRDVLVTVVFFFFFFPLVLTKPAPNIWNKWDTENVNLKTLTRTSRQRSTTEQKRRWLSWLFCFTWTHARDLATICQNYWVVHAVHVFFTFVFDNTNPKSM